MTFESTDLHPSHDWVPVDNPEGWECTECLTHSAHIGTGSTGNCIGSEGLEKECARG